MNRCHILAWIMVLAFSRQSLAEKPGSAFFPPDLMARARANIEREDWGAELRARLVAAAEPWLNRSDDELWDLMFGNTIRRSWMVWSDGHCPACDESVPMYTWTMDAMNAPWKVKCPHCGDLFPKNDFAAFYRSGLDEHGVFDPTRADRSLLFNAEHPEMDDPLRSFGVDDGGGYGDGDKRWWFIGAYLIYGQWKQAIVGGIDKLAAAYVVTGDRRYAHKALVMLDRMADLYPTHDFGKQGIVYERKGDRGYVSTWHDAAAEIQHIAVAYDQVFDALADDDELVAFLSAKARQFKLDNPKATPADIQRNIEQRILVDTINHRGKIESNYPQTDMALCMLKTVLDWPNNRDTIMGLIDGMMKKATAVDGQSGEKGLAGYTRIAPRSMSQILGLYARMDPTFIRDVYKRHPRLHDMYRFHIDTWCLGAYYPEIGDSGAFAQQVNRYVGASFPNSVTLNPSNHTLFWQLYELTGDADLVRVMVHSNGGTTAGMPHDLFAENPEAFQGQVQAVIDEHGPDITPGSVNKQEWCVAILRSGEGEHRRAVWLDYDTGGRHSHADGMNLGLFAHGLDLMPDFGYPPVQFGGWRSPRARWYTMSAAHNTVVVDGKNHHNAKGKTTLWGDGDMFRVIRASCPEMVTGDVFERTVALIDVSPERFYVVDIFDVHGGKEHTKFIHSHFARTETDPSGPMGPAEDFGRGTQMRNTRILSNPKPTTRVDFRIEDRFNYRSPNSRLTLRVHEDTRAWPLLLCEGWVMQGMFNTSVEAWIPRAMLRHRTDTEEPLTSRFTSILEPFEDTATITTCPLPEITLNDGRRDVFLIQPAPFDDLRGRSLTHDQPRVSCQGELCFVRLDKDGRVERIALAGVTEADIGRVHVKARDRIAFAEITVTESEATLVSGDHDQFAAFTYDGKDMLSAP